MANYNPDHLTIRRIHGDLRELKRYPSPNYHAAPVGDNLFHWHFTIRGPPGTEFEGGIYHGRILLPPQYPHKPPHIMFLTPNGRFQTKTKICLSISAFHPELWKPAWGIRLILEALVTFMPSPPEGAVGSLNWTPDVRKKLAEESKTWECPECGKPEALLPTDVDESRSQAVSEELQKELALVHFANPEAGPATPVEGDVDGGAGPTASDGEMSAPASPALSASSAPPSAPGTPLGAAAAPQAAPAPLALPPRTPGTRPLAQAAAAPSPLLGANRTPVPARPSPLAGPALTPADMLPPPIQVPPAGPVTRQRTTAGAGGAEGAGAGPAVAQVAAGAAAAGAAAAGAPGAGAAGAAAAGRPAAAAAVIPPRRSVRGELTVAVIAMLLFLVIVGLVSRKVLRYIQ